MAVVIENPILNSPFAEPTRHFRFDEDGITDEIVEGRRRSTYFIPIAPPKKKGPQLALPGDWTAERMQENDFINQVRGDVAAWRLAGRPGRDPVTRELLDYWTNPDRERRSSSARSRRSRRRSTWPRSRRTPAAPGSSGRSSSRTTRRNPGLYRVAFKMATGSGKTVVMAMLIAWQALNKLANPQDKRFSDTFLVVTPGITIRDRLRVLLPNGPGNYYRRTRPRAARTSSSGSRQATHRSSRTSTPSCCARREEFRGVAATTKKLLADGRRRDRFKETPDQMVRRVCRDLGTKKNIVVLNDEAHHCYRDRRRPADEPSARSSSPTRRAEAKQNEEAARVWLNGLRGGQAKKLGIRAIYDLSATPFFLRGSGYPEGTLFPWVVSDFSLIDAIESGIVKIPRVPVADDQMTGDVPTYRNLWVADPRRPAEEGPRGRPQPPARRRVCPRSSRARSAASTATTRSPTRRGRRPRSARHAAGVHRRLQQHQHLKLVFDWIAGWEKELARRHEVVRAGQPDALHQRGARAAGATARTRSSSTRRSSSRARR